MSSFLRSLAPPSLTAVLLLSACAPVAPSSEPGPIETAPPESGAPVDTVANPGLAADSVLAEPSDIPGDTVAPPPEPLPWPEATLAGLSLRDRVAQMIMPWVGGDFAPVGTAGHDRVRRMVEEQKVGGLIMSIGTPTDVAVKLNDMQRRADIPLLVAADFETGAGFRLSGAIHTPTNIVLGGATNFPSLMAVGATGDPELAYAMGRITAEEARAVGIHVAFAPVLDVNSNPDNPIINTRSFGEDPEEVARLGAAFVRGVEEHGALATGKHFPGHGDTGVDSHLGLPELRVSRARLDSLELRPFREAIDAGIGGIMTAHIAVPALNGDNGTPSTLSRPVLTGLLRDEMGFGGLLFTDAMDMGAIDRGYGREEAAVLAVEAGADLVLMPPDIGTAVDGIVAAVQSGRIPAERIDSSVVRILRLKERMGLPERRTVDVDEIPAKVGIPSNVAVAEDVARRSMTLLRNERDLLPLLGTRSARVLSVTYRRSNDLLAGRWFNGALRSTYPRLTTVEVGRDTDATVYGGLLRQALNSNLVVVSLYVTAVSYSGSVAVDEDMSTFIQDLSRAGVSHVVVSFGNPYLLREFPDAQAYMLAWSGAEVSQRAAVDALFGRFAITGRTPTRLPPFFDIGDGIRLPRRERR